MTCHSNGGNLDDFFGFIFRLTTESDRRYEYANVEVSKYMVKRIQSALNSLRLLSAAAKSSIDIAISTENKQKLQDLVGLVSNLAQFWLEKLRLCKNETGSTPSYKRYQAKSVYTGRQGRPQLKIDFEHVNSLRDYHFNWTTIANILCVHRSTLWRKLKEEGYNFDLKYSDISAEQLDQVVISIKETHPLSGERVITGFLRSKGIHIQRWKIRESIHRVDPVNAALRWIQKNPRWVYSVPGPNSLWHNDGLHKLIHWGMIVHACIDGYSRMITSIIVATNNYADTALAGFMMGVKRFGLPARVRGDKGGENIGIIEYMRSEQDYLGAYIQGPSVHNQRIERLHYDTTHCVLSHYIDLFSFLEENGILDRNNEQDLFALQYVFLPKIQHSLGQFQEGWNHHSLSTEGNKTPYQLWTLGMMDSNNEKQRGVRTYLSSDLRNDEWYGVEPYNGYHRLTHGEDSVELHDICFGSRSNHEIRLLLDRDDSFLRDDSNFGINMYEDVRRRVSEII